MRHWFARAASKILSLGGNGRYYPIRNKHGSVSPGRLVLAATIVALACAFIASLVLALLFPLYHRQPRHYQALRDQIVRSEAPGRGNVRGEKVFIAANIIDAALVRGPWGASLLNLVDILGSENVFVSVYENDSGSEVEEALRHLESQLKCNTSIVAGAHIDLAELARTDLELGQGATDKRRVVTRIEYLSKVRNNALAPLDDASEIMQPWGFTAATETFDKLLFLNDVYFAAADAANLLFSTNQGVDGIARYEAACAVDFVSVTNFYDDFATRDLSGRGLGYGPGFRIFPWFAPGASRDDVLRGTDAVQVRACWGGMVAFKASWFQKARVLPTAGTETHQSQQVASPVVRFRAEREPFWEACECCLLHADITALYRASNSKSADMGTGIYTNPFIRTAYTATTFAWLPVLARFEHGFSILQYALTRIFRYPENSERITEASGALTSRKVWKWRQAENDDGRRRGRQRTATHDFSAFGQYETLEEVALPGGFCGRRGMQYMLEGEELLAANANKRKNFAVLAAPSM